MEESKNKKDNLENLLDICTDINEIELKAIMNDKKSIKTIVMYDKIDKNNKNGTHVIVINDIPYKIKPTNNDFELGDDQLEGLSELTKLALYDCSDYYLTDYSIAKLYSLTHLTCVRSPGITNASVNRLQNLIYLQICENKIAADLIRTCNGLKYYKPWCDDFKLWSEITDMK